MTYSLRAYDTRIDIVLNPDGLSLVYGVIAERDDEFPLVLMEGWARIQDCNFTYGGMDSWPNLNLAETEIRLCRIDDMIHLSDYLGIPMPPVDPSRCTAPQGMPS